MKKTILKNGLTLLHKQTNTDSVTIEIMVRVGSDYEKAGIRGIAHFLEHMMFEGTSKRPNSKIISAEIEDVGGEMNAYTTNDRTAYYIKVLSKHFDKALDVLSDMMCNSTFNPKHVDKERKIIVKEIHMVLDDPRFYKWVLFEKTLFSKHPAKEPTYGTEKDVMAMTQKKLQAFYSQYYQPSNMILSVVGNVKNITKKVEHAFSFKSSKKTKPKSFKEPIQKSKKSASEKKKTNSSYVVMGYKTCKRSHKDSYALDILEAIMGRGQSARMFDTFRNKHGLSYEVGVMSDNFYDLGMFAVHASVDPTKKQFAQELMKEQYLTPVTEKEVKDAKTFIEGNVLLKSEQTNEKADQLCFWEHAASAKEAQQYMKHIKSLSHKDILKVQKKYFTKNCTVAIVGP